MITVTDFFAGGGGSSTGLASIPGVEVAFAANHDPTAVATHAANHPRTHHECADLTQTPAARFPATDLAWFSPSCTHHSVAWGRRDAGPRRIPGGSSVDYASLLDAEVDATRATMLEVVRFSEYNRYPAVIVENVVEVQRWPLFRHWLGMMRELGYRYQPLVVNSGQCSHHGPAVPQSRERWYGVFTQRSIPAPEWPLFHGPIPAVADVLDDDPGRLIADRPRPLAEATMARIAETVRRFPTAGRWTVPYYSSSRAGRPVSEPVGTLTTRDRHAIVTQTSEGLAYRMLRLDETARIGGFPADYLWSVSRSAAVHMIGNAVTPAAARDVAWPTIEALLAAEAF